MDEKKLTIIAKIKASTYRYKCLKTLKEGYKIPTEIAANTGILPNHISKTLKELKGLEVVECVNEDAKKGRLYHITEKGKEILHLIETGVL